MMVVDSMNERPIYHFCLLVLLLFISLFHLLELLIDLLPPGDVLKWTQGSARQAHWEKYHFQNRLRIGHRIDIIIDDPIQRSTDVHVTWSLMSIWSNRHFGHWLSDLYTAGHMCFWVSIRSHDFEFNVQSTLDLITAKPYVYKSLLIHNPCILLQIEVTMIRP